MNGFEIASIFWPPWLAHFIVPKPTIMIMSKNPQVQPGQIKKRVNRVSLPVTRALYYETIIHDWYNMQMCVVVLLNKICLLPIYLYHHVLIPNKGCMECQNHYLRLWNHVRQTTFRTWLIPSITYSPKIINPTAWLHHNYNKTYILPTDQRLMHTALIL